MKRISRRKCADYRASSALGKRSQFDLLKDAILLSTTARSSEEAEEAVQIGQVEGWGWLKLKRDIIDMVNTAVE